MGSLVVTCELLVVACMWDLVPWPGIEPGPPALGAQSLNHWATREVLPPLFFILYICSVISASQFFFLSIPSALICSLHLPRACTPLNPSSYSCWINSFKQTFRNLLDAPLMEIWSLYRSAWRSMWSIHCSHFSSLTWITYRFNWNTRIESLFEGENFMHELCW